MKYADVVGPSRVEPLYEKTFVIRYRPPLGVQVWCPNLLTSYIVQVPRWFASLKRPSRMVSAFLCTPLSRTSYSTSTFSRPQLSPNFWGVLVGLLVVFRDRGLGVPSIALLLDFFSMKEVVEGFLYISKLIISDLLSSHKHWKECYFFVGCS